MTKLKLTRPIEAHNELLEELEFKEPKARNIAKCGIPVAFYSTPDSPGMEKTEVNTAVVLNYIVELAGIPKSSANELCMADFLEAQNIILGFFGESTPSSTQK